MSRGPAARELPERIWQSVESQTPRLSVSEATDHINSLITATGAQPISRTWYSMHARRRKARRIGVDAADLGELATSPAASPMEVDPTPSAEPVAKAARLDGTPRTCGHLCIFVPLRQWLRTHMPAPWAAIPKYAPAGSSSVGQPDVGAFLLPRP